MKGILALIGKPSGASKEAPAAPAEDTESSYAKEAFGALQDGDEEGFVEAFKSAVQACVRKANEGEYDEDEAPDSEDMER